MDHFFLKKKSVNPHCCYCLVVKSCSTLLWPHGLYPTRLLCPWDFPGKNTGEGCHFLLRGIFLTRESNLGLLHWQVDSFPQSQRGSHIHSCKTTFAIIWGLTIKNKANLSSHCDYKNSVSERCWGKKPRYWGLRQLFKGLCYLTPLPEHWERPTKGESTQGACLWLSAFSWVMKSQLQSWKETCPTAPPVTSQPSTSCQSWLASGGDGHSEDKGGCEIRATDTTASHLWQHLQLLGLQKGNRHLETQMTNGFSVQLLSMWYWISGNLKKKKKNYCLSSVGLSSVLSHYYKI